MVAVRLSGQITEDGQLIVQLPQNIPAGSVEVVIEFRQSYSTHQGGASREQVRQALEAAGILGKAAALMPPVQSIDEQVILDAGRLPKGARPTHELIDEDRDENRDD